MAASGVASLRTRAAAVEGSARRWVWSDRVFYTVVGGTLALGLAARLAVAWQSVEELVVKVLQDDAFYYFLTAERITEGQGITFDGVTASNGYHPLWLFAIVPLFFLPGRGLPINAALSLSAILDVLAGGMITLAVRRLTGNSWAALFALFFYLFLPRNILSSVNGLETSVTMFMLSSLLLVLTYVWRERPERWLRWAVITGILGGMMMLARLDSGVVLVAMLCSIALLEQGKRSWQAPLLAFVVASVVVSPWYLWSLVAVGNYLPVSGESATWLFKEHFYSAHPDVELADKLRHGWDYTQFVFRERIPDLYLPKAWMTICSIVLVAALALHLTVLASTDLRRKLAGWLVIAGPPLWGFAALLLFHTMYRWFFREWYFAWGMPMMAMLAGVLFAYAREAIGEANRFLGEGQRRYLRLADPALLGAAVILFAVGFAGPGQETWKAGYLAPQRDYIDAGLYLRENTAPSARVAGFNSGIVAYFSERTMFNIDGVVNPNAYSALRDRQLLAYLRSVDVEYVTDRDQAWVSLPAFIRPDDWSKSLWGEDPNASMVRVAAIGPRFGVFGQMTVFRIVQ